MLISTFFKLKNSAVTKLNKASDRLSNNLRENVILFSFDQANKTVLFLSESEKFLKASFNEDENGNIKFSNFKVTPVKDTLSDAAIDTFLKLQVSDLFESLQGDKFDNAAISWNNVISVLEQRQNIDKVRKEVKAKLGGMPHSLNLTESAEFKAFLELRELVKEFLTKNKDKINESDLADNLKIIKSFVSVFPKEKITVDKLLQEGFTSLNSAEGSLYDILCHRELVSKELLESRQNFSKLWASSKKINELASLVDSGDEDEVYQKLLEAVDEIPYLAIASKADISTVFGLVYEMEGFKHISDKDKTEFTSAIFEMKKPIKEAVLNELNAKYGININALTIKPNFTNMSEINKQILTQISESIESENCKSTIKNLIAKFSTTNGIEALALSSEIAALCEAAGLVINAKLEKVALFENFNIVEILENYYPDDDKFNKQGKKVNKEKDKKPGKDKFGKKEDGEEDNSKGGDFPPKKGDKGKDVEAGELDPDKDEDDEKSGKKKGKFPFKKGADKGKEGKPDDKEEKGEKGEKDPKGKKPNPFKEDEESDDEEVVEDETDDDDYTPAPLSKEGQEELSKKFAEILRKEN